MNLMKVAKTFPDAKAATRFLEQMRWPDGVTCVSCESSEVARVSSPTSKQRDREIFQCRKCRVQFTATSGTIFHDSHIGLDKWFMAIALITDARKGISARQLQRHLGLGSYRSAWHLYQRIRKAMAETEPEPLKGTVEVDETYIGGKRKGKGVWYGWQNKETVMGAIERGGEIRLAHVRDAKVRTVQEFVGGNVGPDTERVMTDQASVYPYALAPKFTDKHHTVNHHAKEYVRGDIYTNTVENAFSLLKRGIIGNYHQVSTKHLHRYLSEFEYRFNRRQSAGMFEETIQRMGSGEPLPYKQLISETEPF
jgi:transposase-like protein